LGVPFGQGSEIAKHRTAIAEIAAEAKLPIAEFRRVVQTVQRASARRAGPRRR